MYMQYIQDKDFLRKNELITAMQKHPEISRLALASKKKLWEVIPLSLSIPEIKNTINDLYRALNAVHWAACEGKKDIVQLLRENGASTTDQELLSYLDHSDETFLSRVAAKGSIEGIRYLLDIPEFKNIINEKNRNGKDIVRLLFNGRHNFKNDKLQEILLVEIMKVLLAAGLCVEDICSTSIQGFWTPRKFLVSIIAAVQSLLKMAKSQKYDAKLFNVFLNAGASVNQKALDDKTNEYVSVFDIALRYGNTEMILAHFFEPIQRDLEDKNKSAIEKMQVFLSWLKERELSKVHQSSTQSEIYFKIANLIADNIVLLAHESFGYKRVVKCLEKIEKNTMFYEEGQFKLAEIYFVQKSDSEEEREFFLKKAFIHACEAGNIADAVILRKKIMKIFLKIDIEIPGDPKNFNDLSEIFCAIGQMGVQASKDSIHSPAKRKKIELIEAAKHKTVSTANTLFLAYKKTPISDNKKHSLDPGERSDSESKKCRAASPTNIRI